MSDIQSVIHYDSVNYKINSCRYGIVDESWIVQINSALYWQESISHPMGMMTGAPEVMQLNCNLMKTLRAKKVLDIGELASYLISGNFLLKLSISLGVFTGWSAFNAALVLPNDGKVVACDITDDMYNSVGRKYIKQVLISS